MEKEFENNSLHKSVLVQECLEWLIPPSQDGYMLDGTIGDGGHAKKFLERYPRLELLASDLDEEMLERAKKNLSRFGSRVSFRKACFSEVLSTYSGRLNLILLDLGVATYHFKQSGRGFSFRGTEPLDMRLSNRMDSTAADILNKSSEFDLAELFHKYGNIKKSRLLARAVIKWRSQDSFKLNHDLENLVWKISRPKERYGKIHPATQVFQALRIAVNDELSRLQKGMSLAFEKLSHRGRIGVISFHSIEDRLVKQFFRIKGQETKISGFSTLTKKPIQPRVDELKLNRRSRSARLRVAEKVDAYV